MDTGFSLKPEYSNSGSTSEIRETKSFKDYGRAPSRRSRPIAFRIFRNNNFKNTRI